MNLRRVFFPVVALSFAFLFLFAKTSQAADISTVDCNIYKVNASLFDSAVNQQRFAQDMATSLITGPMISSMIGSDFGTACECAKEAYTHNNDPEGIAKCDKVKTFITTGGVFLTTKYALDIAKSSKDLINIRYYANDILRNMPFTKTAYAADTSPLPAILDVWKEIRNLSYILFTTVFIIIGFMIMFRKRLDPQTVVTVQSSLPRVVLALVLITFSYPIVSVIFSLSNPLSSLVWDRFLTPASISNGQVWNFAIRLFISVIAGFLAGGLPGLALTLLLGIFFVAFMIALIILIITFVSRLGKIALLTVLAPFVLLIGAVPGNEKTIMNWFKSILAITLQIPALIFILGLGLIVGTTIAPVGEAPLGMVLVSLILNPLLGTFILFQAGKVPKMVDSALGVEPILFGDSGPKKGKR